MKTERFRLNRQELSWVLYDVGNSAFVLVIVTALMPIFFKDSIALTMSGAESTAWWGYANSAASLVLAFLAPFLGTLADQSGSKKRFFVFFLLFGLLLTLGLVTVRENQWLLCLALFVLARVGWAGANLFYDSFLVDICSRERMDRLSTLGYGFGYVGSVVPFLVIIGLILASGMEDDLPVGAVRTGFVIVVLWWLLFSLPMLKNVSQVHGQKVAAGGFVASIRHLAQTLSQVSRQKNIFVFLCAYFFYIDGVGTIISMSSAYGRDLGFGVTMLILVLLFIQLVAFPFAVLYGRLAGRFGTRKMLFAGIFIYGIATLMAFLLPVIEDGGTQIGVFWLIAFLVASSMGGIQALSRSFFARLIPVEKSSEYFGFFNVFGKFAAITGPALMGGVGALCGDSRWGILSILLLFVIGAILLRQVREDAPLS